MCFEDPDALYVILPYFNYCKFKNRLRLFTEFVNRIYKTPGINIVIVEAGDDLPSLPVYKHLKFQEHDHLWIKENLINLAIDKLPDTWKYVAWIDADITFLNKHWVRETINTLKQVDIVQMFQSAINLGQSGEVIKVDKGFGYMHATNMKYTKTDKYGFWHPGYAWACTHRAYDRMGSLIDWAILGSADRHMALAWINHVDDSYPGNIHPTYKAMLHDYQERCRTMKISYVNGTILHHWHGSLENRKYRERWNILTRLQFSPFDDVGFDNHGVIQLTTSGQRLESELKNYFLERQEDAC